MHDQTTTGFAMNNWQPASSRRLEEQLQKEYAHRQEMEQAQANTLGQAQCNQGSIGKSCPSDPCVLMKANELRNYVIELAGAAVQLRAMLFGPIPECDNKPERNPACDGLDGILADASVQAACLLGELRSINNRLGG